MLAGTAAVVFLLLTRPARPPASPVIPAPATLPPASATGAAGLPARRVPMSPALARAVAAIGAFSDGRRETLADLDAEAQRLIDEAHLLLASVPRRQAPGLPLRLPNGGSLRMPSDVASGVLLADPMLAPALDTGARIVDGALVPRRLDADGRAPVPITGDRGKHLVEPDAWIAIPYDPALVAGEPLLITNRSGGRYAVSLEADDFSSVRLDGGLVVPGRFYLIEGTVVIEGAVPIGITIRPLGVLHGVYDRPLRPPSANG
jgi:hypothetical protein